MAQQRELQAVIDTNVLFEGITTQGSAPGFIIDAWRSGLFIPCVSNALAYEYIDVLGRKLSPGRWRRRDPGSARPGGGLNARTSTASLRGVRTADGRSG